MPRASLSHAAVSANECGSPASEITRSSNRSDGSCGATAAACVGRPTCEQQTIRRGQSITTVTADRIGSDRIGLDLRVGSDRIESSKEAEGAAYGGDVGERLADVAHGDRRVHLVAVDGALDHACGDVGDAVRDDVGSDDER